MPLDLSELVHGSVKLIRTKNVMISTLVKPSVRNAEGHVSVKDQLLLQAHQLLLLMYHQ